MRRHEGLDRAALSFTQALKLSQAAGRDAGERSRKNAGRDIWNQEDWDAACDKQHDFLVMCGFAGTVLPTVVTVPRPA